MKQPVHGLLKTTDQIPTSSTVNYYISLDYNFSRSLVVYL